MFHLSTVEPETFALLQQVFKIPFVKNQFALAVGTSLALQVGHRKSIDLDFFSAKSFIPTDIEILLKGIGHWQYEPMGKGERMLFCLLNKVKCDFRHEPFPLIENVIEWEGISFFPSRTLLR